MPPTVFFRNLRCNDPGNPLIHGFPYGVAYFSEDQWWYSGINYGGSVNVVPISQPDIAMLKSWIFGIFGDEEPQESDYRAGTAYKRISRPLNIGGNFNKAIDAAAMTQSFVALDILLTKMQDIFETVEPGLTNLQTYGHKIRELLLLASMEVEASWAAVLKTNGYIKDHFTTKDYVKLNEPMMLGSYSLKLRSYPAFPDIAPFKRWISSSPTKSLDWYGAYNRTKHNREECLDAATLGRAVNAVGAAAIMYYAQFGNIYRNDDQAIKRLRNVYVLGIDREMYPTSCYIPNAGDATRAWDWELLDYPFPA